MFQYLCLECTITISRSSCSNSQHYVNSSYTFFWHTLYPIHYLQHMFFLPISVMFFWYHLSEHLLDMLCFFLFFSWEMHFSPQMPLTLTRSYDKVTSVFVSSRNQTSISIIHTLFSCTSLFPPDYYKGCERNLINFSYQTKFFFSQFTKKKCFLGNCKQFCGFF